MSRLWVRIFAGMVLANAMAMVGVVLTYQSQMDRHRDLTRTRDGIAIARIAERALAVREDEGAGAAEAALRDAQERTGLRIVLLDSDGRRLAGDLDPGVASAAILAGAQSAVEEPFTLPVAPGLWQGVRLRGGRLALGIPEQPLGVLGVSPPVMQLLVVGLLAVVLSLLVARWTSEPLRTLRHASEQLLAGPGAVRVGSMISPWADSEARALASDFDRMAARIEGLLAGQERLLRDVSHELRSPLARLNVALELASESAGSDAAPFLARIAKESERLDELIGLVLTMAKLDQVNELSQMTEFSLDALVTEICEDAAFEAERDGRTVDLALTPAISMFGDEELLRRAIENVVRNAVRWTPPGTAVDVSVTSDTTRTEDGEDGRVAIRVRDLGPGVPEDALNDIFQPFTRLQTARERSAGGAGIGLAITARALSLHGGRASAANAAGGGLCVTLELPVKGVGRA